MNNKNVKVIPFSGYKKLVIAFQAAVAHLEYCGYGDTWERECSDVDKLPQKLERMVKRTNQILELNSETIE